MCFFPDFITLLIDVNDKRECQSFNICLSSSVYVSNVRGGISKIIEVVKVLDFAIISLECPSEVATLLEAEKLFGRTIER